MAPHALTLSLGAASLVVRVAADVASGSLRGVSAPELPSEFFEISKAELTDKIGGLWVGQLVGNFMGLPFEFSYIDAPLPKLPAMYYDRSTAMADGLRVGAGGYGTIPERLNELQGAYTDDDTDIEFVTLHAVQQHGLGLTYPQIAEAWKTYVHAKIDGNDALWFANLRALQLMQEGLLPPATGYRQFNQYWWAIDPQLVNEIWSGFYPGMVEQAVKRAQWGARITSSDWGVHPTLFYGALISAAFVKKDVRELYDMASLYIPTSSPFHQGLQDVKSWHAQNSDWRQTRALIVAKYGRFPSDCGDALWNCGVSAIINGLFGAMAVLYGEGDFMKTVGTAIAAGYDCDNAAATLAGLMGVIHGLSGIPRSLTHEIAGNNWSQPFNDRYVNERRPPLPKMNSIREIIANITEISRSAILENGGVEKHDGGSVIYAVKVSGLRGPSIPAGMETGDDKDGCCGLCGAGEAWCSPKSHMCYSSKRQDYYLSCCCSSCGNVGFCSPISGYCYGRKQKDYYRNCTAA